MYLTPAGTKYRHENGSIWIKEAGGFFHCPESKRTAPPAQAAEMLASGKFIVLDTDSGVLTDSEREQLQKELEDEQRQFGILYQAEEEVEQFNQENLDAYEAPPMEEVPQKTLSEKLTEMWKSGLISQDEFLELIKKNLMQCNEASTPQEM